MSKEQRYIVQSEQIRGERRVFYVVDRSGERQLASFSGVPVDGKYSYSEAAAQRRCDKLNGFSSTNHQP
jgi:hypothetical protein